ncbi:MAG: metal-binding protein [Microvirga sp.]|nr:metal-binding protein [Microvirga sp.]
MALSRRGFLAALAIAPAMGATGLPKITVTKDPSCGCCTGWTEHVRAAGFSTEVVETNELNRAKVRLGVPAHLYACHTAEVDGYVIEGHVPAPTIRRLVAERPNAKGLAVRGMPVGSPGMEVAGAEPETYDVIAFGPEGESRFARYRGAEPM